MMKLKIPFQLKVRIVPRRASDSPTQMKIELRSIMKFAVIFRVPSQLLEGKANGRSIDARFAHMSFVRDLNLKLCTYLKCRSSPKVPCPVYYSIPIIISTICTQKYKRGELHLGVQRFQMGPLEFYIFACGDLILIFCTCQYISDRIIQNQFNNLSLCFLLSIKPKNISDTLINWTPWLWSASKLCRPSDRHLLAK
jgi:hypothetical protein